MSEILRPSILLISHKYDFSTDNISHILKTRGESYFRLNRDQLPEFEVIMDPTSQIILGRSKELTFEISPSVLKSIYYRAPTFPRDAYNQNVSVDEQLQRSQWAAFVRSLVIYENAFWMNNPVDTYKAEMKPYQLFVANKIGFKVPSTVISNSNSIETFNNIKTENLAIKTIDTGLVSISENDGFVYTSFISKSEIKEFNNNDIPFIAQEALRPKLDLRITVVGDKVFPISISSRKPIDDDWRLKKYDLEYQVYPLPQHVIDMCIELLKVLHLSYGAIDLVYCNKQYYFIEINPTGEWDWLVYNTGIGIDSSITEMLCR